MYQTYIIRISSSRVKLQTRGINGYTHIAHLKPTCPIQPIMSIALRRSIRRTTGGVIMCLILRCGWRICLQRSCTWARPSIRTIRLCVPAGSAGMQHTIFSLCFSFSQLYCVKQLKFSSCLKNVYHVYKLLPKLHLNFLKITRILNCLIQDDIF